MKTPVGQTLEEMIRCPITGEPMKEPMVDPEGVSYEKEAILEWLSRNSTSPITRNVLRPDQLVPNRALRDLLDELNDEEKLEDSDPVNDFNIGRALTEAPHYEASLKTTSAKIQNSRYGLVQVSVSDDQSSQHLSSEVVCVIDVSYSMDDAATMHGDSEGAAGLSLLDIVKHATKTVIETLTDTDKLAVVSYADSAKVVLPFMKMTKENRAKATAAVESLQTRGSTNIWDGLLKAMDLIRNERYVKNANILLLTDGMPNVHPPRGELPTLLRYKESHPDLSCKISTFGFGYSLDSQLLNDLAVEGGGHFGFIPDSSFVGTIFINTISNVLSTAIPESTLLLEAAPGVTITKCQGFKATSTSWGMSIQLPSLRYGQTLDVLVEMKGSYYDDKRKPGFSVILRPVSGKDVLTNYSAATETALRAAFVRSKAVSLMRTSKADDKKNLKKAGQNISNLLIQIDLLMRKEDDGTSALKQDLEGQISEALSRQDWYSKWGRHYLLSLGRAHELQQCSNFKDPGVQQYSTQKFSLIRDMSEDIFCKLPPPTPSLARDDNYRPLRSMSAYHNSANACFAAGSVKLSDGRFVSVDRIKAGDEVVTTNGSSARVRCVVVTACEGGLARLVRLEGGVLVTPWHPVRVNGSDAWSFPAEIASTEEYLCKNVYSFILEGGSGVMQIGPYEVVTLGHGIVDDPVAKHEYLGTQRVIEDVSKMVGWRDGKVELGPNPIIRDHTTGKIIGFQQKALAANFVSTNSPTAQIVTPQVVV